MQFVIDGTHLFINIDCKQFIDGILSVILTNFKLNEKLINKIKEYQSKDQLQNEKGLERYIDKILTEKAEKIGFNYVKLIQT